MSTGSWKDTRLWKTLEETTSPSAEAVRATLPLRMPEIQTILTQGGTAPTDFTLHDAQHSFRTAERMAEIIPADALPDLSAYELALLLLSAYLHDIGMTPEQRKVKLHYDFLLTGDKQRLSAPELDAFQRWLDDQSRELGPPLSSGQPSPEVLHLASEVIAHFCRDQHNDWARNGSARTSPVTRSAHITVGWTTSSSESPTSSTSIPSAPPTSFSGTGRSPPAASFTGERTKNSL